MRIGSKKIFHLEAWVVKVMSIYKVSRVFPKDSSSWRLKILSFSTSFMVWIFQSLIKFYSCVYYLSNLSHRIPLRLLL